MTHRAQPLAAISTEKTGELVPLYFVFLNSIAVTWIYMLQQNKWTKKPMLLKEQNHILKEKLKQIANLNSRINPLPPPWNRCGYLKDRNARYILSPKEQFSLTSLFTSCYQHICFCNWYEENPFYIIKVVGSTIHLSKSPTFHPENEERRNFQEVIQDTISQGSFSRQLNVQHIKCSEKKNSGVK